MTPILRMILVPSTPLYQHKPLMALIVCAVLGIGLLVLRGGPTSWSQTLVHEMEEGFRLGYPGRLANLVDPEYDAFGKFPELKDFRPDDPNKAVRGAISRVLSLYFLQNKGAERSLTVTSTDPAQLPSGDYEVAMSFAFRIAGGSKDQPQSLSNHRFVLRQDGWLFPSLNIIDHDPIAWP